MDALGYPAQSDVDAAQGPVAVQPVLLHHSRQYRLQSDRQNVMVALQGLIDPRDEFGKVRVRVNRPVFGQKVIVTDIQDDAGVTATARTEQVAAGPAHGMAVCKSVDTPVEKDAVGDLRVEKIIDRAFDKITHNTADQKFIRRLGQIGMCEIVHQFIRTAARAFVWFSRFGPLSPLAS